MPDWISAPDELRLRLGLVHVWRASLLLPEKRVPELSSILSEEERERADRFKIEHLRPRYVAAHAILRILLGRYLETAPEDVSFTYSEKAKPRLSPNAPGLSFNISDSNTTGLFAFTRGADVGVDLEALRPLDDMEAMAGTVFTPGERERLFQLPEKDRSAAFFQAWTVKEAALKATGEGIAGLQRIEALVSIDDGSPVYDVREIRDPKAAAWTIHLLHPASDFAAAVAIPEEGFTCRTFDAGELLG